MENRSLLSILFNFTQKKSLTSDENKSALTLITDIHEIHEKELKIADKLQQKHRDLSMRISDTNPFDISDSLGYPVIIYAAENGHKEIIIELINAKANINIQDGYGRTTLEMAVRNNLYDIAKILIEAGADLELHTDHNTLIDIAIENNTLSIVYLLLLHNTRINNPQKLFDYLTTQCTQGTMEEAEFCLEQLIFLQTNDSQDNKIQKLSDATYQLVLTYLTTLDLIKKKIFKKTDILSTLLDATPKNELSPDVLQLICEYEGPLSRQSNKPNFFQRMNTLVSEPFEKKESRFVA